MHYVIYIYIIYLKLFLINFIFIVLLEIFLLIFVIMRNYFVNRVHVLHVLHPIGNMDNHLLPVT